MYPSYGKHPVCLIKTTEQFIELASKTEDRCGYMKILHECCFTNPVLPALDIARLCAVDVSDPVGAGF